MAAGETPLALIADDGIITACTREAAQLIGLGARDAVGRRAEFFLGPDNGRTLSQVADGISCHRGWSDNVRTPLGDRRNLRVTRLRHAAGEASWLLSAPTAPTTRAAGVAVWDQSLRCTMADDVMEQSEGVPQGRLLGHRMAHMLPGIDSDAVEAVLSNVLRTGATALDYRWELRLEATRSRARTHLVSIFRLEGADGNGLGVCSLTVDVTAELQQRERFAVLGEASLRIDSRSAREI